MKTRLKPVHPCLPQIPLSVDEVDTRYLETLVGYNARRAALAVIGVFMERMAEYDLRIVDFSVTSLILHHPGITSRQLCSVLGMLQPNLVSLVSQNLHAPQASLRRPDWWSSPRPSRIPDTPIAFSKIYRGATQEYACRFFADIHAYFCSLGPHPQAEIASPHLPAIR